MDKEKGDLGIKNLKHFNGALLGRWAWKLLSGGKELWKRIFFLKNVKVIGRGGKCKSSGRSGGGTL